MMNLVVAAISPKTFARGTHSYMESFRNIIMNGVRVPPPPRPPAFAKIVIQKRTKTPITSSILGGKISSFICNTAYTELSPVVVNAVELKSILYLYKH